MNRARSYRKRAEACLRDAHSAPEHTRAQLVSLAARWLRLADHCDATAPAEPAEPSPKEPSAQRQVWLVMPAQRGGGKTRVPRSPLGYGRRGEGEDSGAPDA